MVYCSTTVKLTVSGHVWNHAISGTLQNPTHARSHLQIYITHKHTHMHEDTHIQFLLLNNVFVVHASHVFAMCQLYLTWPARNDRGGVWIWHTCQIWQAWAGCDWEVETTAITKVSGREETGAARKSQIVKEGEEEAHDESLEVKWQESQEKRLRAERERIWLGLVKWKNMRLPVYLYPSLRCLLFSHQAPGLDTQLQLKVNDTD